MALLKKEELWLVLTQMAGIIHENDLPQILPRRSVNDAVDCPAGEDDGNEGR